MDSDDGSDGGDSGDHSPPEMPGTQWRGRSMDAPFLITVVVITLIFAAFIFYTVH